MPDDATERLLNAIDAYADSAYGSDTDGGELARQRALAIDAYAGKNIEPAPSGRSQVVDWTVFETIQWILPSLTRIFAGGDNVVEFEPQGPDDEESAQQESDYLNHVVQKENWFLTVLSWCQDALLTKNAYCLVETEEKLQPEKTRYEMISEEQVAAVLDDDVEVVGQEVFSEETIVQDPQTGEPIPTVVNKFTIEVKRTKAESKLKFKVLTPENCIIDEDTPDFTLADCNYFEYHRKLPISELRKMGFDVPDDIPDDGDDDGIVDFARDEILQSHRVNSDDMNPDPAMRRVMIRWIWIRHDTDEDGVAELQHVIRVGRDILFQEEVNRIPVACIVPFINTHRHMGNSIADAVFDIGRIKTALLRAGLDSLYLATNPRHVVSGKTNIDDMLTSRPGGLVRLTDVNSIPGEGHVVPLITQNVFPDAQQGLQHMDSVTEARAGVSRIFQGIDESQLNDHNRIGQLSSMAAQRVEQIARIFASGFERLFSLAHEQILKSGHQEKAVRLRGKWVNVDPSNWKTGRDLRVTAPFAAGNKDALLQRLFVIAGLQEKALAAGLPIVTAEDAYEMALEISKAADVPGEKFWTDPEQIPPPEPQPDYTGIALDVEQQKVEQREREAEMEAEVKRFSETLRAELDKYRIDTDAEVKLLLAKLEAGEKVNLERVKHLLGEIPELRIIEQQNERVDGMESKLQAVKDELIAAIENVQNQSSSPRELVRDDKGNITGVRVNGKVRKVKRDKQGNIVGL